MEDNIKLDKYKINGGRYDGKHSWHRCKLHADHA